MADKFFSENELIDIKAIIQVITSFFTSVKQNERNIVQVNGNNNTVQIPNEEGPGSNVQGTQKNLSDGE